MVSEQELDPNPDSGTFHMHSPDNSANLPISHSLGESWQKCTFSRDLLGARSCMRVLRTFPDGL